MPPAPINALRFVHTAIQVEAEQLEEACRVASSPAAAGELAPRFAFLAEVIDYHTSGEEIGLFPALVERAPRIADTYLFDHEEEETLLKEINGLVTACAAGGSEEDLTRLRRQSVALAEHITSHIRKENELILPAVEDQFTPPEQGAMVGKILSAIPQEKMALAVPWVVERQSPEVAEAYVRSLMMAMPPPVFTAAKGWIQGGVPAERWNDLTTRIPELAD